MEFRSEGSLRHNLYLPEIGKIPSGAAQPGTFGHT